MTNEEAKQEAIKKAYGNHYSICKPNHDGWGRALNIDTDKYDIRGDYGLRPKSLKGIEDNNGWIRIETDGSNLPTDKSVRYKVCRGELIHNNSYRLSETLELHKEYELTHYKPIKPEKHPIY